MAINGRKNPQSLTNTMRSHIKEWEKAGIIHPIKELKKMFPKGDITERMRIEEDDK